MARDSRITLKNVFDKAFIFPIIFFSLSWSSHNAWFENFSSSVETYALGGQLFLLGGHFEKAAFSGGPNLLMRVEASLDL